MKYPACKLPPSRASRRAVCPGSRALEAKFPDAPESPYTREGIAAHWIASTIVKCGKFPMSGMDLRPPNGEPITDDMLHGANLFFDSVQEVVSQPGCPAVTVEKTIEISTVHPECWGTPDAWVNYNGHLHVWDYKFGFSFVEVFENWQLLEYAAGILELEPAERITFYVVQPRSYHKDSPVRKWTISLAVFKEYKRRLIQSENIASMDEVHCTPSPECNHCLARHACKTLQSEAMTAIDISKMNTADVLDAEQTGRELSYLKRAARLLESRLTGLEEQTKYMIKRGKRVPGFKMESVSSKEIWTKPDEEVFALGGLLGVDLSKPASIVTPSQARKLGVPEVFLEGYVSRQSGALKLVTEDERTARKIFGGI